MSQFKVAILIAAATLAIGYLPGYLHLALPILTRAQSVVDLGTLVDFQTPACTPPPTASSGECGRSYLIPMSAVSGTHFTEDTSLSLGVVARSVGVKCKGDSSYAHTYGSIRSPGLDRTESNKIKTLELNALHCQSGYVVDAWGTRNDSRVGWISGPLLIGPTDTIQRYKLTLDFYLNDLRLVITTLLMTLFLITVISRSALRDNYIENGFEEIIGALAFLNAVNSGLLSFLIPSLKPFTLNALSVFISTLIPLFVLKLHRKHPRCFFAFALASLLLCFSPAQDHWRHIAFLGLPAAALLGSLRTKDFTVLWFCVFCCLAAFRTIGFEWAPHTHIHSVYALMAVSVVFFRKISGLFRSASTLLQSSKRRSSESLNFEDLWGALRFLSTSTGGAKVSIFAINSGTACDYYSYGTSTGRLIDKFEFLPPIVAHSTSTGSPRFHLDVNSKEFQVIVGASQIKNPHRYTGKYITAFPSRHSNGSIYIVTLTNYGKHFAEQTSESAEFEQTVRLTVPTIVETLAILCDRGRAELAHSIRDARSKFLSSELRAEESDIISLLSDTLSDSIPCRHIIFTFNEVDRSLAPGGFYGFSESAKEYLQATQFFAKLDNLQGPSALAMNTNTPVAVEDVRWLKQVLKEKTFKHFTLNDTNSCLAIPIQLAGKPWGIVWLESSTTGYFRGDLKSEYFDLMSAIVARVSDSIRVAQTNLIESQLSKFVPEHATQKIKNGIDPKEEDYGLLLMVDMRGSTALSMKVGTEQYHYLVTSLATHLQLELSAWKIQDVRWDAFFFTLSEDPNSNRPLTAEVCEEIELNVNAAFNKWRSEHLSALRTMAVGLRTCLTRGDTSRDVVKGNTMHWTITGPSMAVIHKIEAAVKSHDGSFFIDLTSIPSSDNSMFSETIFVSNPGIHVGVRKASARSLKKAG